MIDLSTLNYKDKIAEEQNNKVWIKDEGSSITYKYTISDLDDLYYLVTGEYEKIKTKVQEEVPEGNNTIDELFNKENKEQEGLYNDFLNEIFNGKKEIEEDE